MKYITLFEKRNYKKYLVDSETFKDDEGFIENSVVIWEILRYNKKTKEYLIVNKWENGHLEEEGLPFHCEESTLYDGIVFSSDSWDEAVEFAELSISVNKYNL